MFLRTALWNGSGHESRTRMIGVERHRVEQPEVGHLTVDDPGALQPATTLGSIILPAS